MIELQNNAKSSFNALGVHLYFIAKKRLLLNYFSIFEGLN